MSAKLHEIEREIENGRARLGATLDDLSDKMSIDDTLREASDAARAYSADLANSVTETVKRNPFAVALIGAGIAMAAFNVGPNSRQIATSAKRTGQRARQAAHDISDAGETAQAKVKDTAGTVKDQVADLQHRFAEGTEGFTKEARTRVATARRKAHEMAEQARDAAGSGRKEAVALYQEHPLAVGAMAALGGAALGALLGRTRVEDTRLGAYSDALTREAERVYEEEKAKAREVAKAALKEGKSVAKKRVAKAKSDVRKDAKRVATAARKKAEKNGSALADI